MRSGSQQATKAATPKHTHNDRHLSECFNIKVLCWPIFSIGDYMVQIMLVSLIVKIWIAPLVNYVVVGLAIDIL